jgi:hypothetical protein
LAPKEDLEVCAILALQRIKSLQLFVVKEVLGQAELHFAVGIETRVNEGQIESASPKHRVRSAQRFAQATKLGKVACLSGKDVDVRSKDSDVLHCGWHGKRSEQPRFASMPSRLH